MRLFFFILLLVFSFACKAQQTRADWLREIKSAPEDTAKVSLYSKIATSYVGVNYDSGFYYAATGLSLAKKLDDELAKARMYNSFAGLYMNLGDYTSGKAYADSTMWISKAEGDAKYLSGAYITIGNYYRSQNNLDSAIISYNDALALKIELNDSAGLGACYNSLGFCYYMKGDVKSALDYYYKSVAIREGIGDIKGIGNTYLNISFVYLDRKERQPAIEALDKAYDAFYELGIMQSVANVCNAYGIVYMNDKQYDSALVWYGESKTIRAEMQDSAGLAECYNNIGNIFNELGKHDSALFYYRQTLKLLHWSRPDAAVNYLSNYATSASILGQKDSALWALNIARDIVREYPQPQMQIAFYGSLSTYHEATGRYDSALHYIRKMHHISDSVYRQESMKALGEMETKYQTTKKEKEIKELTAAQEQKDLQLLSLSIGAGLLVLLAGFVIYGSIQRKKTNQLLEKQNEEISEKNKDITDSITYARRIQQSVLPDENLLFDNVKDAFIMYKPRDIVSGDFYWFRKEGSRLYIACADCTGHGVPGALVSVIGVNLLEQIVSEQNSISTGELLDQLHRKMYTALHKDSLARGSNDGMDIALLCLDTVANVVEFSGASRPVSHYSGGKLVQVKGTRFSIGGVREVENESMFGMHTFPMQKGDAFYLFTDGFADQFGGPASKKFMSKKFIALTATHAAKPMNEQHAIFENEFSEWKGSNEQVDDVLVIGIRI